LFRFDAASSGRHDECLRWGRGLRIDANCNAYFNSSGNELGHCHPHDPVEEPNTAVQLNVVSPM
jgi:hypothetical protein